MLSQQLSDYSKHPG